MKLRILCAVLAGSLTIGMSAELATASVLSALNPVADAFVTSANPTNNYGAAGALSVSAGTLANGEFQSVLRFDTSAAKTSFDATYGAGNWTVQSITLKLTAAAPNNSIFNNSAAGQFSASWMQNDSWVEGTGTPASPTTTGITFSTLPGFLSGADAALGTFAFNGATSGSVTYTLGMPAGLLGDVGSGSMASMRLFAADSTVSYLMNSRNFGQAALRPELDITAVPEPASAMMLIVTAMMLRRRRGVE
ncbi:MAG TPA: hypothetical protein VMV81_01720 [Phycisphaerae bacterium]|nr:hypothetical protein [Phycisphaerae bacterium]